MALTPMATYLSEVTADYTATELSIAPDDVMVEEPDDGQVVREYDDGTDEVIDLAPQYFFVNLQWVRISETDANTITAMYHDSAKANRRGKSFYWQHPEDTYTYTVKFASKVSRESYGLFPNRYSFMSVRLKVIGKKPAA